MNQLKHQIALSSFPTRHYMKPDQLGQMVQDDLTAAIKRQFPLGTEPTEIEVNAFWILLIYVERKPISICICKEPCHCLCWKIFQLSNNQSTCEFKKHFTHCGDWRIWKWKNCACSESLFQLQIQQSKLISYFSFCWKLCRVWYLFKYHSKICHGD